MFPEGRDPKVKRVFARSLMSQAALTVGSNRRSKLLGELLKAAVRFAVDRRPWKAGRTTPGCCSSVK
jgi:hypothetical protein